MEGREWGGEEGGREMSRRGREERGERMERRRGGGGSVDNAWQVFCGGEDRPGGGPLASLSSRKKKVGKVV